jgi:hypothetical protein
VSKLAQVTKGKIVKPLLLLVYGADGVGKSSFAASAPAPIFFGPESGTDHLDVSRYPEPKTWAEVQAGLKDLATGDHDYKTLAIDSLDWIEPLLFAQIIKEDAKGAKSIEQASGGWGKGYVEAESRWRDEFIEHLDTIRNQRKMNVVLIAHSEMIQFNDPQTQLSYKRYELKLHKRASALFREYVDAVLFGNYEAFVKKEKDERQAKIFGDGARVFHTERRPGFDAKNRYGLPFTLPLSWEAVAEAAVKGNPESPEAVKQRIEGLLSCITDKAVLDKMPALMAQAGDNVAQLSQIANRLAVLSGSGA